MLANLGASDYGIYSLVGSIIVFVQFINWTMASGAARYFAYSIGQGDTDVQNRWFNTSLSIHLALGVILVGIGWPVGTHLIHGVLSIPENRIETAALIFNFSLLAAFICMISVPYSAQFTAHQRITEVAFWGLVQSLLTFTLAFTMHFVTRNKLLVYAISMSSILILIQLALILRSRHLYSVCAVNFKLWFDKKRIAQMTSFSGWTLIGSTGSVLRDQGSAIVLNTQYGSTAINAAYGIAMQVSAQTNQLSASLIGAFTPEITSSEGRGDSNRVIDLATRTSKYGALLVAIVALPLIFEMDVVLMTWLAKPPQFAAVFCRYILATFILDRLTTGYMVAINAKGQISGYQLSIGMLQMLTLPIGFGLITVGVDPNIYCIAFVVTMVAITLGRVIWMKKLFEYSFIHWWHGVIKTNLTFSISFVACGLLLHAVLAESIVRTGIIGLMSPILAFCALLITNDQRDKEFLTKMCTKFRQVMIHPRKGIAQ